MAARAHHEEPSGSLAGEPIRAADLLTEAQFQMVESGGISQRELDDLLVAMEEFWMYASGQVGAIDEIQLQPDGASLTETRGVEPMGYYTAFRAVQPLLADSLRQAGIVEGLPEYRHPGWDITPFGYIAKTCRDAECFSTGSIPGVCITRAEIVDAGGNVLQELFP